MQYQRVCATPQVRTQFVIPFAERAAVSSALRGLEHCFTFAVDRLAAHGPRAAHTDGAWPF